VRPQQWRPAAADANLPHEIIRGTAADLDDAPMDAAQVMPRTDRDSVPERVLAAA